MDGVFMFKLLKLVLVGALILGAYRIGTVARDSQILHDEIIRLHVVANSDTQEDQELKLQVRDAVVAYLGDALEKVSTKADAREFLEEHLDDIADIANRAIALAGFSDKVKVTLIEEEFDTREYDSFSLPAGVYDSLRIVIGEGSGKNWWCVVFPSFCLPKESFEAEAAGSGFSDGLTGTLQKEQGYEVRFWVLDCIGRIKNWLHG